MSGSAYVWTGKGDGVNWENSKNWDKNSIPTDGSSVSISNANIQVSKSVNIGTLSLSNNAVININKEVLEFNRISCDNSSNVLQGNGAILLGATGTFIFNGRLTINTTVNAPSNLTVDIQGNITISGPWYLYSSNILVSTGSLIMTGVSSEGSNIVKNITINSSGSLILEDPAQLTLDSLTIQGALIMEESNTPTPTILITVDGTAILSSTSSLTVKFESQSSLGVFLKAATIQGSFSTITGAAVTYSSNSLSLAPSQALPVNTPACVVQYLGEMYDQVYNICKNSATCPSANHIPYNAGGAGCNQLNDIPLGVYWNVTLYNCIEQGSNTSCLQQAITACYAAARTQWS